jgi:hypothetical protein
MLELIGMLLPLLVIPEEVRKEHVVMRVNNLTSIYDWMDGRLKNDSTASPLVCLTNGMSTLFRMFHLITAFLEYVVYVEHLPSWSSWETNMADNFTRVSTVGELEDSLKYSKKYRLIYVCSE